LDINQHLLTSVGYGNLHVSRSTDSFFWLLIQDRLNTRNVLGRKNFTLPSYMFAKNNCKVEETLVHLFWNCSFAQKFWDYVCPQRASNLSVLEAFSDIKEKLNLPFFSWRSQFLRLGEFG
jgi:hypothetical protein